MSGDQITAHHQHQHINNNNNNHHYYPPPQHKHTYPYGIGSYSPQRTPQRTPQRSPQRSPPQKITPDGGCRSVNCMQKTMQIAVYIHTLSIN